MKLARNLLVGILCFFFLFIGFNQTNGAESLAAEQVEENKKLSIKTVDVVDTDILKLSFGVDIDDTKEKDFIVSSLPLGDEIEVTQIVVDKESVLISIENEFETDKQYEVVIISLYGTDGSTIVSGIDGAVEFTAPDMTQFNKTKEVVKAIEKNTEDKTNSNIDKELEDEPELNAAGEKAKTVAEKIKEANKRNNSVNLAGKEVDKEELDKNIAVAAGKAGDLPTTGPEHVFFIILALVLAGLIFHIKRNKV